jgi:hypothetical protein
MAAFLDGCRFNPAAGGTADWTYSSAVTGYQSPAAANVVNGRLYKYRAESADLSQWEMGEGAYNTSTGVLSRTTVLFNSSGTTSKINFTTIPQVAIVALKEDLISVEEANSFTSTQQAQACANIGALPALASGTAMIFQQSSAPTGWTKRTTHNDKALRIVSGTASSGGTNAFSTVMAQTVVGATTLASATIPALPVGFSSQILYERDVGGIWSTPAGGSPGVIDRAINGVVQGSGGSHTHSTTMDMQYVDAIIATKD